ncbi:MAG: 30S ribosomal protein S17 [Candidatus Woesearchaeota archaeon]|nr:30S ribosomal protein S17 [Candidatus Woesearchaeota archaeon]
MSVSKKLRFKMVKEKKCKDSFCPFHGKTKLRGRVLLGNIVRAKAHKTVTVVINRKKYVKKYERYEMRKTKILAHNSPCIGAKLGDRVKVKETRPLSKRKHFAVVEVLNESS